MTFFKKHLDLLRKLNSSEKITKQIDCPVNKKHLTKFLFVKRDAMIFRCQQCGTYVADLEKPDTYEGEEYYTMRHKSKEAMLREWGFRYNYVLDVFDKYDLRGFHSPNTILDVGAGNGIFVYMARKRGYAAEGLEISRSQIGFAKTYLGVELQQGILEIVEKDYGIVTAFNVLEHVIEPRDFLLQMKKQLKPNGYICLLTPSAHSFHRFISGTKRWNMINPPQHITIFSQRGLVDMVNQCGFDILETERVSTYLRILSGRLRWITFKILRQLGLGADIFILAQKRAGLL